MSPFAVSLLKKESSEYRQKGTNFLFSFFFNSDLHQAKTMNQLNWGCGSFELQAEVSTITNPSAGNVWKIEGVCDWPKKSDVNEMELYLW